MRCKSVKHGGEYLAATGQCCNLLAIQLLYDTHEAAVRLLPCNPATDATTLTPPPLAHPLKKELIISWAKAEP